MKSSFFRICSILAISLVVSLQTLQAQQKTLDGVWDVTVTVTNCDTGALIRTVRSLQAFHHDGSVTETANTAARGISEGVWAPVGEQNFTASYWFFRYQPDGAFASFAKITDNIHLVAAGELTSTGVVQDFDANGTLISTGCFVHAAYRLAGSEE